MAPQLGHQAAGIVAVEAPVDLALQFGRRDRTPPVVVAVPERLDALDPAEHARFDHLDGLDIDRIVEPLLTDEHDPPGALVRPVDVERFVERAGHRLLAVDVLAGLHRRHGDLAVQVQRHGDNHRIERRIVEHLPVVRTGPGRGRPSSGRFEVGSVVVAQPHHFGLGIGRQKAEQILSARSGTDHRDAGPLVAHGPLILFGETSEPRKRREERRRSGSETEFPQEIPAGYLFVVHSFRFHGPPTVSAPLRRVYGRSETFYFSSRILMFLNETASPWSCNRICPRAALPKFGQSRYLLYATSAFHEGVLRSYSSSLTPLSQCST